MSYPTQMPPMPLPTEQEAREMAVYYGEVPSRTCWSCGEPTDSPVIIAPYQELGACQDCASDMKE